MWRAGVTYINGERKAENFPTKDDAELWILAQAEEKGITRSIIVNKENIKERFIMNWENDNG